MIKNKRLDNSCAVITTTTVCYNCTSGLKDCIVTLRNGLVITYGGCTGSVTESVRRSRVVGGDGAAAGAWPWQAALYRDGDFQCGATLIHRQWLLSASHCFYQ